MVATEI